MQLFSSSSSSSTSTSTTIFLNSSKQSSKARLFPIKSLQSPPSNLTVPSYTSSSSSYSNNEVSPVLQEPKLDEVSSRRENLEQLLVRRPMIQSDGGDEERENEVEGGGSSSDDEDEEEEEEKSALDRSLEKFAKKLPIFEPGRGEEGDENGEVIEKPLKINLDLALYKAKILTRNFQFDDAENILQQCIYYWPEDGRPYVALGKVLRKQSRITEARAVYEKGSQATQGENPYIWQCWAVLESDLGNTRKARELFDAATVADKKHIAAWHGWAVLELKQGNIKKARNLLGKGIKYCGGNEYVYQTLALLEAKANRYEQASYLFRQATRCNPKSCASWLAWAQLEMQQENNQAACYLFEKAVQASPKNRFAWHVWGLFEANLGNIDKARKILKIGHLVNPRDPVLLQSLALLEYRHSTANASRILFKRASELDPRHQPVWIAWGWMEWKEGNISTARELYQKALSINSTTESAARCLQAWGVLEQKVGNLSAARRLFRSSLNINSQSYVTWMTWASLEEDQGNSVRAEEIRNLYFQQRTEVVDDASWVNGFLDIIDPALDSIKRLLNLEQDPFGKTPDSSEVKDTDEGSSPSSEVKDARYKSGFDLDSFIKEKFSLDPNKLDDQMETSLLSIAKSKEQRTAFRPRQRYK
ncbi:protein high chlorophyll fluorescent 107-like [Chenopodium quinoa]|nr:protein high chlorophyll fluorescent 107-like [Chenopodium quinoa]